jgi:uncharacterized RDD family membrane protein YckC
MENKFAEVMSKRTDEELIQIITVERGGYEPLAVEAAEQEIKNRNIPVAKTEEIKINLTEKLEKQATLDAVAVSPLTRLIHFVIDTIAFILLTLILSILFDLIFKNQNIAGLMASLILFGSYLGYFIFMENKFQKTIGKFVTKTKVIKINGDKPELGDIVVRTLCRLIPFDRVSFIFTRNGFHDYLSKTTVIKDEE